ncbi:LOW QUALITY PROTEIN: hypothetical protein Dda_4913 [Drechslerella dactyloides]|uniref:Dynein light intermediate chain n=1 Tax=Drechslerella dactyloides TaxID=74499 RepID=A0AAD6J231_DREDA|nr:LOW QUALITY PROTEIN: hypothetical protein Dda_4913 [Drechslerella dactyloides]
MEQAFPQLAEGYPASITIVTEHWITGCRGGADEQKEFVDALGGFSPDSRKQSRRPPVANEFALGYTYLDVLDAEQEDVLARLGLYLVSSPTPAFSPLLKPLFTPELLPDTLVVLLLDWRTPWTWLRQTRRWIRLLRNIFSQLDNDAKEALEEVMKACPRPVEFFEFQLGNKPPEQRISRRLGEARPRNFGETGAMQVPGAAPDVQIPLGPGEFDEPLGLPLLVVCQNADNIETLERERGWKEEEFDFVLQFMRTILLKHGASLIYTTPSTSSSLQPLVYTCLSLPVSSKACKPSQSHYPHIQAIRHNVIERERVLVPPSWDSWGKIRVLRDFDVEGVGSGWSVDIDFSPASAAEPDLDAPVDGGAVELYEEVIRDSRGDDSLAALRPKGAIEMPPVDLQEFLSAQLEVLESKKDEEKTTGPGAGSSSAGITGPGGVKNAMGTVGLGETDSRVRDHVGPVQFNVGGIQVDADDMLRRIKDRDAAANLDPAAMAAAGGAGPASPGGDGKSQNEVLAQFFSSLMNKKGAGGKGGPGSGGGGGAGK